LIYKHFSGGLFGQLKEELFRKGRKASTTSTLWFLALFASFASFADKKAVRMVAASLMRE